MFSPDPVNSALQTPPPSHATNPSRQRAFADLLASKSDQPGKMLGLDEARAAAEDFVSVVFIKPLLEQLRGTNNAAPPFAPSEGERQFGSLLDDRYAREIARASNFPLVDRIAHDLVRDANRGMDGPQTSLPSSLEVTA